MKFVILHPLVVILYEQSENSSEMRVLLQYVISITFVLFYTYANTLL